MRFFDFLGIQHYVLYLFPAAVFILLFFAGLRFSYIKTTHSQERESRIIEKFPDGIEGRNAPFPLILLMTIAGAIVWGLLYIFFIGAQGVKF